MKKEKTLFIIILGLISAVLACVMFMQFKVVNETDIEQLEFMRTEELELALDNWKEKYTETEEKLKETTQKIQEYNETFNSKEEAVKIIESELEEANIILGKTDVSGNGVEITLTDNDENEYSANDILELINELRAAGADAISVNGQRVINLTNIVNISNKYIMINKEKISSPYVIKAIGDKTYLESALNIKNGYVDTKIKRGYDISVQSKNNIKINKYSKDINLNYIKN